MKNKILHFLFGIAIPLLPVICIIFVLTSLPETITSDVIRNLPDTVRYSFHFATYMGAPCGGIGLYYLNKHLEDVAYFALFSRILCILDIIISICLILGRILIL